MDTNLAAALVRVLTNPRGRARPHVDMLKQIIREIVRDEHAAERDDCCYCSGGTGLSLRIIDGPFGLPIWSDVRFTP